MLGYFAPIAGTNITYGGNWSANGVRMKRFDHGKLGPSWLTFVLILPFLTIFYFSAAATAANCSAKLAKPIIQTTWVGNKGPSFTITPGSSTDSVTKLNWATSLYREAADNWEPFSAWKSKSLSKTLSSVAYASQLRSGYTRISITAYSENACGTSAQNQITVPLLPSSKLKLIDPLLPLDIPLSVGEISATKFQPNLQDLPLVITSSTPSICSISPKGSLSLIGAGTCSISLSENSKFISIPNSDLKLDFHIEAPSALLSEALQDRPDDLSGFQIHIVYVTVKNTPDHNFYQNGKISSWVTLAQDWLQRKLKKSLKFDTYQGNLDVSTMHSQYTRNDLNWDSGSESKAASNSVGPLDKLESEYLRTSGSAMAGKNLLFIVDANTNATHCGLGDTPGSTALVNAGSNSCWTDDSDFINAYDQINWMSATIIHELLHNLGVEHTCVDSTDIMLGDGCNKERSDAPTTLDASGKRYVGGSLSGVNILSLKVWGDGSGTHNLAQPDLCFLSEPCTPEKSYWTGDQQKLELQQKVNNNWVTLATFSAKVDPQIKDSYKYYYDVKFTPAKTGTYTLRYRLAPNSAWLEYLGKAFTITVPY
ncbi:MAG: hypothetical protein WCO85_08170 [Actinomycetes bacterium]